MPRHSAFRGQGFTLLEVALAIALLGIVLTTAMELLSVGLRSARTSSDYTEAVLLAKRKLAEVSLARSTDAWAGGGSQGSYRWRTEVAQDPVPAEAPARLLTVTVTVTWPGRSGEKRVELVTQRAALGEETFGVLAPARGAGAGRAAERTGVSATGRPGGGSMPFPRPGTEGPRP